MIMPKRAIPAQLNATLPRGKWLATHARVDGIEDPQTIDIRHPVHGDRIATVHLRLGFFAMASASILACTMICAN
jgi:hypothetical protein